MSTKKPNKTPILFKCEKCNFNTCNKKDFNRHLSTLKHKILQNTTQISPKNENCDVKVYLCGCGKKYKHHSSLWTHKKKCSFFIEKSSIDKNIKNENEIAIYKNSENRKDVKNNEDNEEREELRDLVCKLITENNEIRKSLMKEHSELIKENKILRDQISELIPKVGNNNNNTHNNKFNIQVFLNEKCRDAVNMSDFIKSIQVSLHQLDFTKENGLADGLSKTIIDNMNKLSLYERPLHCTDIKRETLYIKDDDVWEKDQTREKIKNVIKTASSKNYSALQEWRDENPEFMDHEDKTDYFTQTIITLGNSSETVDDKIIKNICKETYVKEISN